MGQTHDYTALSLVKRLRDRSVVPEELVRQRAMEQAAKWSIRPARSTWQQPVTATTHHYQVLALHRYPRGTSYTEIVESIRQRLRRPEFFGKTRLILDRTGVGRPVFDLFQDVGADPIGITFSGGNEPTRQDGGWVVPKADLVGALQATMGTERTKVAGLIPEWHILREEMQNLEVRMTPGGHAQFASDWRRKDSHDDLLFSLAIALWYGESVRELDPEAFRVSTKQ